jgi:hypothetical protein
MEITDKDINEYIDDILNELNEFSNADKEIIRNKLYNLMVAYPELAFHYPICSYTDAIRGIE